MARGVGWRGVGEVGGDVGGYVGGGVWWSWLRGGSRRREGCIGGVGGPVTAICLRVKALTVVQANTTGTNTEVALPTT